jgi:hypothetical protein
MNRVDIPNILLIKSSKNLLHNDLFIRLFMNLEEMKKFALIRREDRSLQIITRLWASYHSLHKCLKRFTEGRKGSKNLKKYRINTQPKISYKILKELIFCILKLDYLSLYSKVTKSMNV